MLLLLLPALAADLSDDFSTDQGLWTGGTVVDGVLRVADGPAVLDVGAVTSFTATLRVRMTTEGRLNLEAGGQPLQLEFIGPGAVLFGETRWPLPPEHVAWAGQADPVRERGDDYWDGGNVLHTEVFYDDETATWFMYWTGEMKDGYPYREIGVATSTDGVTWTAYPGNPVLSIDYDTTTVDGIHVHMPTVVREASGTWHMFYACYQNNVGNRICHATSREGILWDPLGVVLDHGAAGEFDSGSLRMPDVWIDDGGTWHMWYDGTLPDEHYGPTGYATSPDGTTWTKHGAILPAADALQGLSVWASPYGLVSFHNKDDYFRMATASKADPSVWTDGGVVLTKGWASWNDGYIQAPSVWVKDTTWKMWFNGYTYTEPAQERIGTAEAHAQPGGWLDVGLRWDGTTLTATVHGADMTLATNGSTPLRVYAEGTAELDDLVLTTTVAGEDSGDTAADTAGGDTEANPPGGGDEADGCGCNGAGAPTAAGALVLGLAALRRRRR